jgi:hypothetical protein
MATKPCSVPVDAWKTSLTQGWDRGNLKPKNNESNRQPLYLVPLYKECWYGYYCWSIKNAKRHQTKRETRVSYSKCLVIVVLILHYCFYLRPASNHLFDDRPEYSTHLCMIGSRFINPHFPAVLLCQCFSGLEGLVCCFCVVWKCTYKKTVFWTMMHII